MGMNNDVFEAKCKEIVRDYFNSHADKSKSGCYIGLDDVYVVWMVRVLGNNKALLSTNITDGMYYEITRNGQTGELYVDAYKKMGELYGRIYGGKVMQLNFIDVSKHQGTIDWAKVAKEVDGVIIRCAYRGYGSAGDLVTDEKWNVNIQGAIDAGIKRIGVYIFSQAVNAAEGKEEAEKVLSLIKPYGDKINYPVYWDTEKTSEYPNGRADCISKANRTAAGKAFCEAIKAAGYVPGVYASLTYFDEGLNKTELDDYTWWVAAYRNTRPTAAVDSWQYSSTGRVNGISGNVDKNYWYKEFAPQQAFTGWKKSGSRWYYYEADKMVKNAWRKITGTNGTFWYFLGANGVMLTGTQKIGGKIYHLNEKAACGLPEGALVVTDQDGVVQF